LLQILTEMDGFKESTSQACYIFSFIFSLISMDVSGTDCCIIFLGASYWCNQSFGYIGSSSFAKGSVW